MPYTRKIHSINDFNPLQPTQTLLSNKDCNFGLKELIAKEDSWQSVGKIIADYFSRTQNLPEQKKDAMSNYMTKTGE